jgi:cytosine deaminase
MLLGYRTHTPKKNRAAAHGTSRLHYSAPREADKLEVATGGHTMTDQDAQMLNIAIQEARLGLDEGGIPIGAALFHKDGTLLGRGRNRRIQEGDPSVHGETDAFRKAGRQRGYRDTIMVTTLAPCWYCSGLVRQFGIPKVIVGESRTFRGGIDWLRENGIEVIEMNSTECEQLLGSFIERHPDVWNEDIGTGDDPSQR